VCRREAAKPCRHFVIAQESIEIVGHVPRLDLSR
jgi:hypothetical protein